MASDNLRRVLERRFSRYQRPVVPLLFYLPLTRDYTVNNRNCSAENNRLLAWLVFASRRH